MTHVPRGTYNGHSVGFEVEFGADDSDGKSEGREVRIGPFYDIAHARQALALANAANTLAGGNALSTLHINFGLDEQQATNYHNHKTTYDGIMTKLSYLSNSASRNLKLAHKQSGNQKSDFLHSPEYIKSQQTERAEYKNFCLAEDADFPMLISTVTAMWKALDHPLEERDEKNRIKHRANAQRLNEDLDAMFEKANIHPLNSRLSDMIPLEKFKPQEVAYMNDFGQMYPVLKENGKTEMLLFGRQAEYRLPVREYLRSFSDDKPHIPKRLFPNKAVIKAYHDTFGPPFTEALETPTYQVTSAQLASLPESPPAADSHVERLRQSRMGNGSFPGDIVSIF